MEFAHTDDAPLASMVWVPQDPAQPVITATLACGIPALAHRMD